MRSILGCLALLWHAFAVAYETDFDTVVVGTSPISMCEALYRSHLGERVLILEESERCGGAWKSIPICGVPYADLGCHQIGSDAQVKNFLEEYIGCHIVSLDFPNMDFGPPNGQHGVNGFYFAKGCHELIENITTLIGATDAVLLTGHKLDSIVIDEEMGIAEVKTQGMTFTASKLVVTPSTYLYVENHPSKRMPSQSKIKYYHVYLLIEDPTPPRFSYKYGAGSGISRLMNLTYFSDLFGTGMQLIAVQTHNEYYLDHQEEFFNQMKKNTLIDEDAVLLRAENYVYEQSHLDTSLVNQYKSSMIEVLNTGHFLAMSGYIGKWKSVLKPFKEALIAQ